KEGTGLPDSFSAYHVVLAVHSAPADFGGINGLLPAKRGSPPFIPPSAATPWTAARGVVIATRAIPPKIIPRIHHHERFAQSTQRFSCQCIRPNAFPGRSAATGARSVCPSGARAPEPKVHIHPHRAGAVGLDGRWLRASRGSPGQDLPDECAP